MERTEREVQSMQTAVAHLYDAAIEAWDRGDKDEATRLRNLAVMTTNPHAEPGKIIAIRGI